MISASKRRAEKSSDHRVQQANGYLFWPDANTGTVATWLMNFLQLQSDIVLPRIPIDISSASS
jgi:hypothetical protein